MPQLTPSPISPDEERAINGHLRDSARASGWDPEALHLYFAGARLRSDGLYVPTEVPGEDAWQRAERMQALEDAWNEANPPPDRDLILVPVGVNPDLVN